MKKVSIIVPVYNGEATIARCLDSLLTQTYPCLEILVIDDGSSDRTRSVLEPYRGRIHLLCQTHSGVAAARNMGLQRAAGDFLLFGDADAFLGCDCVERVVQKQRESGADLVRFSYQLVYPDGRIQEPIDSFTEEVFLPKAAFTEQIYPYFLSSIRFNAVWATLYPRELLAGLTFPTGMKTAEDAAFSLEVYTRAQSVLLSMDAVYFYVQTPTGLTRRGLGLLDKYRANLQLSGYLLEKLRVWGMDSFPNRLKTYLRPLMLTIHKLRRLLQE